VLLAVGVAGVAMASGAWANLEARRKISDAAFGPDSSLIQVLRERDREREMSAAAFGHDSSLMQVLCGKERKRERSAAAFGHDSSLSRFCV